VVDRVVSLVNIKPVDDSPAAIMLCHKSGRWFQNDLSINSERCKLFAPSPYNLKNQWHIIMFHENASSK